MEKNKKSKNIITISVFCLLIGVLTVASILTPTKKVSEKEKRELAQMPKFTLSGLFDGSFTKGYESFITDQFVGRDTWVAVKNKTDRILGKMDAGASSPQGGTSAVPGQSGNTDNSGESELVASGGVYFGKDGYLIAKHEYKKEQLDKNIGYIEKFVSNNKGKYNVHTLIAPTASLILSDKLPERFGVKVPVWDQNKELFDRLTQLDGFVDCRKVLLSHNNEEIYYRTDHHWTTLGAYYAYTELCRALGITPLKLSDFNKTEISNKFHGTLANKVAGTDLPYDTVYALETDVEYTVTYNNNPKTATNSILEWSHNKMGNAYSVFLNENQPIVEISRTEQKFDGKTLVMFKDSYSNCMVSMLLNHYDNIVLLDLRYQRQPTSNLLSTYNIKYNITDVVLFYNAENFTTDTTLGWLAK